MLYPLYTQFVLQRQYDVFDFRVTVVFERLGLAIFEEDLEHIWYWRHPRRFFAAAKRRRHL